jgi:DNA repair exonuclease SbcCD ATPase subunit
MRKAPASAAGESARTSPAESHCLRHIRVIGGYLDGAEFELARGLNCLIGARGTGKTTVLELVRFALNSLPDDPNERRRVEAVVRANLGDGRVELGIETKEGLSYIVSRAAEEESLVLTPDGSSTEITLRGGSGVFRADIYSQNQIEQIADRALAQLTILDSFEATRIAQISADIHAVESKLVTNAGAITPLQGQIDALTEEIAGLPAVEHKLKALPPMVGKSAGAIEEAQAAKSLRHRETQAMEGIWQFLPEYDSQLEALHGQLAGQARQFFTRDMLEGPNGALITRTRTITMDCAAAVDEFLRAARNQIAQTQGKIGEAGTALTAVHAQQDVAFRTLIEKDQALRGQATERANLERLKNDILVKRRQRETLVAKLAALQKERTSLLDRLSELRDQRYRKP